MEAIAARAGDCVGVTRVVLTGSESTGKTTLAGQLAAHFDAELIPEFVRGYAARKVTPLDFDDHDPIARGVMALEDEQLGREKRLIVQDTDLLSTELYLRHYYGQCPQWITEAGAARRPDLYLLCEIDVPWVADGVRDRGHMREEVQQLFRDAVLASGVSFVILRGGFAERLDSAVVAIECLLGQED